MRRSRFLPALAALAGVLFTQIAIAAAAWDSPPSPCHELAPTTNVCFQHCGNNDLTLDVPRVKVPAAAPAPAPVVVVATARYPEVALVRFGVLPAGPPPRILFRSFLI